MGHQRKRDRANVERQHQTLRYSQEGDHRGVEWSSSPLPSPTEFEGFERVLPGAAERIMAAFELEQRHRHKQEADEQEHAQAMERRGLTWGASLTLAGLVGGLLILLGALGAGVWLLAHGYDVAGYTSLVTAVGAIVTVFVRATRIRQASGANPSASVQRR